MLGVLGAIVYPGGGDLRVFDLNKEQTFPATFSGLLLFGAGAMALLNGVVRSPNPSDRRWWLVLAASSRSSASTRSPRSTRRSRIASTLGPGDLTPIVIAGVVPGWWR